MFMLPTRFGFFFAAALFAMLLVAINYGNGLAYGFTFLLGAMALTSMLYTHRNLAGTILQVHAPDPVFAGEAALFPLQITNETAQSRPGIWLLYGERQQRVDLPPQGSETSALNVATTHRGTVRAPIVRLSTAFPFGLLYTWSAALHPQTQGLVYPRPAPPQPLPQVPDRERYQQPGNRPDGDDFMGLRNYQNSDPPRHVHWKAAARGQGLLTKRFGGAGAGVLWVDWDEAREPTTEARLSLMCRWVLDAEEQGAHYGLRLPGVTLSPDHGYKHQHRCLAALATWGIGDV